MTKSQEKYYKIVCPSNKQEVGGGWENDLLMQRDGTLIRFFPFGLAKRLKGYGASDLAALGVGWGELLFHLC